VSKKEDERRILQQIYDLSEFAEVGASERPDFVLTLWNGNRFGVEVTEIFPSGTDARVQKIPGYVEEIIDTSRYRHKEDLGALPVNNVEVQPHDGRCPPYRVDAIISEAMNVPEFVEMLTTAIKEKNEKAAGYAPDLAHVNLIIADRCGVARRVDADDIHATFCSYELLSALRSSAFREVYLLTQVRDLGNVYVPLKMLDLLATLFLVQRYIGSQDATSAVSVSRLFAITGDVLQREGAQVHLASAEFGHDAPHLFFGNAAVTVANDGGVSVLDLADTQLPVSAAMLTSGSSVADTIFLEGLRAFADANDFRSAIAFPTRSAPSSDP
jgi:hypothetical protein